MSGEQTFVIPDDELEKPVTINIDGDEPKPGDPPPQQSAPKAPPPVVQDPGIETLKQQLARERQGRLNAEKVAQELSQRNAVGSVALVDTHIQSVINEIAAVERDGDLAQQALADALATGNAAEAAKFQRIIARVESQRSALEAKKIGMENYKQQQAQVRPESAGSAAATAAVDWRYRRGYGRKPDSGLWRLAAAQPAVRPRRGEKTGVDPSAPLRYKYGCPG